MSTGVAGKENALALVTRSALGGVDPGRFQCLPGCGRCCGYKVSVLEEDIVRLEAAGAGRGDFLDDEREPAAGFDGCMRKRSGFCVVLDESKRCRRYESRPLYCRLYPYVREAYVSVQLDVDLSCPGVGKGEAVSEEALATILAGDDAATNHAALLESRRAEIETVERLLSYRGRQMPFEEIVDTICAARARGLEGLSRLLSTAANKISAGLTSDMGRLVSRGGALSEDAEELLADYLVFWSRRQVLWRWSDAYAAVTPAIRSREEAMMLFLLEAGEAVRARAAEPAHEETLGADHIAGAIQECDSSLRTYCQSFRLSG